MVRLARAPGSLATRTRWLLLVVLLLATGLGGAHGWGQYHHQQARKALAARNYSEARAHVQKCLQVWPTGLATHLLAARIERLGNRFDQADNYLQECRRLAGKTTPDVQLEWYLLQAQQGDVDAVLKTLWQCVKEEELDALPILETLALVYLQQSRFRLALAVLDRWLELEPENARALDWRSLARVRTEQNDLAADDCEAALKLDRTLVHVRLRLCDILMDMRQSKDAESHLQYLREQDPERHEALVGLARCRMEEGNHDEARRLLEQALQANPAQPLVLLYRGEVELRVVSDLPPGDDRGPRLLAEAESWLRRALKKAPGSIHGVTLLHRCLKQQPNRAREAAEALSRYQHLRTVYERYAYLLTRAIDARGQDNARNATELAELLLGLDFDNQVLDWLHLALKTNPHYLPAHRVAIAYYQKNNQPEKAAEHRRLVTDLAPGQKPLAPAPKEN